MGTLPLEPYGVIGAGDRIDGTPPLDRTDGAGVLRGAAAVLGAEDIRGTDEMLWPEMRGVDEIRGEAENEDRGAELIRGALRLMLPPPKPRGEDR